MSLYFNYYNRFWRFLDSHIETCINLIEPILLSSIPCFYFLVFIQIKPSQPLISRNLCRLACSTAVPSFPLRPVPLGAWMLYAVAYTKCNRLNNLKLWLDICIGVSSFDFSAENEVLLLFAECCPVSFQ